MAFTNPLGLRSTVNHHSMHRLLACKRFAWMTKRAMSTVVPLINCTASLEVLESGDVRVDATQEAHVLEEAPASRSHVRTLWLNRANALHALTPSMNSRLMARLDYLDSQPDVRCIILRSNGKQGRAFCAGGDIRLMYENVNAGHPELSDAFFREEYKLNDRIANLNTPLVALMDGIVMGGGVGLAYHARFRVATQHTVFAMPECAIGLHPDIGASYFLPRLKGPAFGAYLALTGARVRAADNVSLGVATHYSESHMMDDVVRRLESVNVSTPGAIDKVLNEFATHTDAIYSPPHKLDIIERCFKHDDVESIVRDLEAEAKADDEVAAFARETLAQMRRGSPTSLKVSLESVRRGARSSLKECLDSEFRLSVRCSRSVNIKEGIHAAVIDRSKPPMWAPSTLEEVRREDVDKYFAPLDDIPELGLCLPECENAEVQSRM